MIRIFDDQAGFKPNHFLKRQTYSTVGRFFTETMHALWFYLDKYGTIQ